MRRHRTDTPSLVFALIFLGAVAWYVLGGSLTLPALGWFVAGILILVGLVGLVSTVRSGRPAVPDGRAGTDRDGDGTDDPGGAERGTGVTSWLDDPGRVAAEDRLPVTAPPAPDSPRPDGSVSGDGADDGGSRSTA